MCLRCWKHGNGSAEMPGVLCSSVSAEECLCSSKGTVTAPQGGHEAPAGSAEHRLSTEFGV